MARKHCVSGLFNCQNFHITGDNSGKFGVVGYTLPTSGRYETFLYEVKDERHGNIPFRVFVHNGILSQAKGDLMVSPCGGGALIPEGALVFSHFPGDCFSANKGRFIVCQIGVQSSSMSGICIFYYFHITLLR